MAFDSKVFNMTNSIIQENYSNYYGGGVLINSLQQIFLQNNKFI